MCPFHISTNWPRRSNRGPPVPAGWGKVYASAAQRTSKSLGKMCLSSNLALLQGKEKLRSQGRPISWKTCWTECLEVWYRCARSQLGARWISCPSELGSRQKSSIDFRKAPSKTQCMISPHTFGFRGCPGTEIYRSFPVKPWARIWGQTTSLKSNIRAELIEVVFLTSRAQEFRDIWQPSRRPRVNDIYRACQSCLPGSSCRGEDCCPKYWLDLFPEYTCPASPSTPWLRSDWKTWSPK